MTTIMREFTRIRRDLSAESGLEETLISVNVNHIAYVSPHYGNPTQSLLHMDNESEEHQPMVVAGTVAQITRLVNWDGETT